MTDWYDEREAMLDDLAARVIERLDLHRALVRGLRKIEAEDHDRQNEVNVEKVEPTAADYEDVSRRLHRQRRRR